jgi:hypothetical protein
MPTDTGPVTRALPGSASPAGVDENAARAPRIGKPSRLKLESSRESIDSD